MQASLALDLETVVTAEPITAWRTWALSIRRDEPRLRPVAGRAKPWPPLKPAQATCRLAKMHMAPNVECSCGLHGSNGLDLLRKTKDPSVLGRVALWGRVIEHELGYRAEFAYPQRLRLLCPICFWQWGAVRSKPDVVGTFGLGRVIPFCEEHLDLARRYGMSPRGLLLAEQVDQELRSTYAVDALAI